MRLKSILLALLLAVGNVFSAFAIEQITAENYTKYKFTSSNYSEYLGYYAIATADDLYAFAALVNDDGMTNSAGRAVSIIDNTGKIVVNKYSDLNAESIQFTVRKSGVYFVKVADESFEVLVK
ncbi:MAG: T9SS type A sorting domain-containing protein [Bacteroidales bacterium]|nr:T9SS type A sorting domain-containing protein [Bacteroidales bacterium]